MRPSACSFHLVVLPASRRDSLAAAVLRSFESLRMLLRPPTSATRLLDRVDHLVARQRFRTRSQAIETALAEKLARLARTRLAEECAKLDPAEEQQLADEGLAASGDSWPEY